MNMQEGFYFFSTNHMLTEADIASSLNVKEIQIKNPSEENKIALVAHSQRQKIWGCVLPLIQNQNISCLQMKNRFYQPDKTVMGNYLILFYVTTLTTASTLKYCIYTNMNVVLQGFGRDCFAKNAFCINRLFLHMNRPQVALDQPL